MGSDSAAAAGTEYDIVRQPKVFVRGGWIVGFCGDWRVGALVRLKLRLPKLPEPPQLERAIAVELADDLRALLKASDVALNEDADDEDWSLLVGARGEIWELNSFFQALRSRWRHTAIGSGAGFALGSLDESEESVRTPAERIRRALKFSARRCTQVRAPFTVLST
jgi:ATP-dependent protease HslVU (ClpYQ) peptidase subunit